MLFDKHDFMEKQESNTVQNCSKISVDVLQCQSEANLSDSHTAGFGAIKKQIKPQRIVKCFYKTTNTICFVQKVVRSRLAKLIFLVQN